MKPTKKIKKLSERQDRPLGEKGDRSVVALEGIYLPRWLKEFLTQGLKYPVGDKIKESQFSADIDIFLSKLKIRT